MSDMAEEETFLAALSEVPAGKQANGSSKQGQQRATGASHSFNTLNKAVKHWVVAYSGGCDSTLLLYYADLFLRQQNIPVALSALHVNHGISSLSDSWQDACRDFCQQKDIPFHAVKVTIPPESQKGLEQKAREVRYQAFESFLKPGDLLLMGHHADDQIETFFLRLSRGAGVDGLKGMPLSRDLGQASLFRPFLNISREVIENECNRLGLAYIDDPSNLDITIPRNFVRHKLLPLLRGVEQEFDSRLLQTMSLLAEQSTLMKKLLEKDFAGRLQDDGSFSLYGNDREQLDLLAGLLRMWFGQLGLQPLSRAGMKSFLDAMVLSSIDAQPEFQSQGNLFQRFQHKLYCHGKSDWQWPVQNGDASLEWDLSASDSLVIPGVGILRVEDVCTETSLCLQVRPREGGERVCIDTSAGTRALKKLFQECQLPPWLRSTSPLVYSEEELLAVPELGMYSHRCPSALKGKLTFNRENSTVNADT